MRFFKNAVYVLFSLSLLNLAGSFYMYRHIMSKQQVVEVKIPIGENLRELPLHAKLRDTQILQAILMTHHQLGIHEPGSQPMCPMCGSTDLKTVEKVIYNNGKTIQEKAHN
jgi:hypothetical protein